MKFSSMRQGERMDQAGDVKHVCLGLEGPFENL